jgi:hypothetical protein
MDIDMLWHHEYMLALYGVLIWHVEQYFHFDGSLKTYLGKSVKSIGSSLIWVGILIVFDDELLAQYNKWAHSDYFEMPYYGYILIGFFVDVIRTKLIN